MEQQVVCNLNALYFLQETIENVKKCKNFLSTLIKLASTGKQSTETAASVRELVKELLVSGTCSQETHTDMSLAMVGFSFKVDAVK